MQQNHSIAPDTAVGGCGHCAKFMPHYIKLEGRFYALSFGHCALRGTGGYLKLVSKPCGSFALREGERQPGPDGP